MPKSIKKKSPRKSRASAKKPSRARHSKKQTKRRPRITGRADATVASTKEFATQSFYSDQANSIEDAQNTLISIQSTILELQQEMKKHIKQTEDIHKAGEQFDARAADILGSVSKRTDGMKTLRGEDELGLAQQDQQDDLDLLNTINATRSSIQQDLSYQSQITAKNSTKLAPLVNDYNFNQNKIKEHIKRIEDARNNDKAVAAAKLLASKTVSK